MKGFVGNIEDLTEENENFRKVIYTGKFSQLVVMSLKPGEEIGAEVHETHDQFFRFEKGKAKVTIDGNEYQVEDDFAVIVPAGANHNVANTGDEEVKLYTIYSPAEHREGVIHAAKEDAAADDEHFDGVTTEQ
ncbi:MAG: cupin domain-containing protein [Minisyncoccales bacterium]|jgi:mannose-6-phosphate isomerase-like protein (cupin superfamily)|nr:cupin domain-containing protein [Candidatus Pacearchaeota archaeon]